MPNTSRQTTGDRVRRWLWAVALTLGAIVAASFSVLRADAPENKSHLVLIQNMRFTPATIEVRVGDRVTFKNEDLVPHTATSTQGRPFDSGLIEAGASWSVAWKGEANSQYRCTFHPTMTGSIVVTDAD
jgi:plastocyanin